MSRESSTSTGGDLQQLSSTRASQTEEATQAEQIYAGTRNPMAPVGEECAVTVDDQPLECRYDLLSASPSGFEWGYGGSGPAQLAIAILAHAYDDEFAREWYQQFKRDVVATLPENGWTLTKDDLDEWRREVVGDA